MSRYNPFDGYGAYPPSVGGGPSNNDFDITVGPLPDQDLVLPPEEEKPYSEISERVINSPAYQSALSLFQKENDKSWLTRLELIPYSVSDTNLEIFDHLGIGNNYENKQDALFQYCMEQISALVAEYQTWKNSLPSTQVQQFADAGINSAITGQGISGSEIPNVGISSNPDPTITNNAELFSSLSSFLGSVTNGPLAWLNSFVQIGQNNANTDIAKRNIALQELMASHTRGMDKDERKRAYTDLNLRLAELGIMPVSSAHGEEDINQNIVNSSYLEGKEFESGAARNAAAITYHSTPDVTSSVANELRELSLTKLELLKLSYKSQLSSLRRTDAENRYNLGYYGDDPESYGREIGSYDKEIKDMETQMLRTKYNYMQKLKDRVANGDPTAALLLNHMIDGMTAQEFTDMSFVGMAGPLSAKYFDFISDLIGKL